MVSEPLRSRKMFLTDRVVALEMRTDGIQMEVQKGLDTLQSEMKRAMARMMEKLVFMIKKKMEGHDPERKENGLATTSPKTTQTSEIPPNSIEIGASTDNRNRSKEPLSKEAGD